MEVSVMFLVSRPISKFYPDKGYTISYSEYFSKLSRFLMFSSVVNICDVGP